MSRSDRLMTYQVIGAGQLPGAGEVVGQHLVAGEVVDHDLSTLTLRLAPVDDALAERTALRFDVAVALAVGEQKSTVVDVLGSRLLDDLGLLAVECSIRQNTHLVSSAARSLERS